jgi:hypothetical protein
VPTIPKWKPRDSLAALVLFLGTAIFTIWQNAHVAVLWDLAYLLDSSYRISLGQIPYREFPFAHAPLTFLTQALIIKLFGRIYWHHVLYAALAGACATLLTWRITLRLLPHRWWLATILCTPLIALGIYGIYPHPIYDSDCILSTLLAIYLLQRAGSSVRRNVLAGAACVLPLFFKQNIGLIFLATILICAGVIAISRIRMRETIAPQLTLLAGATVTLLLALVALHFTVRLSNYRYWTLTFAAQRRLPGFGVVLGVYHQASLLWTIPAVIAALLLLHLFPFHRWTRVSALALMAAPFIYAACIFVLADDSGDRGDALLSLWPHLLLISAAFALYQLRKRASFITLLPIVLLATIHGTFLSQQLWGSTYALWPLLTLLLAMMLHELSSLARPLAITIATMFLLCGTVYAASHERLSYSHLDGPVALGTLPPLRGLATPGPYIPDLEELIRYTNQAIPADEGIVLVPGQDPFYFTSGRIPRFPVLLLDPATNPYSPQQMRDVARRRNIQWLIVNRNLQLVADPISNMQEYIDALAPDFTLSKTLTNYSIYRRR